MSLTQYRKVSKILTVGAETTVTMNNIGMTPCTGPVFKCIVENLNKMVLPSPINGNTTVFQGIVKVIATNGDIGVFMLVGANPKPTSLGDFQANEIWIAKGDSSFWEAEYGVSQASDMTLISTPTIGMTICFDTITGSNPNYTDTITPLGWTGPIISPTLRGHRSDVSEDLAKALKQLNDIAGFDLSTLLKSDNAIIKEGALSWTSGMSINIASGTGRYKGIEFEHDGASLDLLAEKTLYKIVVNPAGTYIAQAEVSSGGTLDSDYNPTGTSPLPSAMPSNPWAKVGTGVDSVASGILTMTQNAQVNAYYQRLGVVGPSAIGSFIEISFTELTTLAQPFTILLDDGVNREIIDIFASGEIKSRNDIRKKCALVDLKKPFKIGLSLKSGKSKLYINGGFAFENTTVPTAGNAFAFGWINALTGNSNAKISRVTTYNAGERVVGFPYNEGAILGTVMTSTIGFAKPVGVMERGTDFALATINLDGWNRENIGKVFFSGATTPAPDELIMAGYNLSRIDFASLFFSLGITFGSGNGIDTFTIPNALDRTLIGSGSTYLDGATGGAATHTLTSLQMPVHAHTTQGYLINVGGGGALYYASGSGTASIGSGTGNAGSGQAHNNMQPYLALMPVIKFK